VYVCMYVCTYAHIQACSVHTYGWHLSMYVCICLSIYRSIYSFICLSVCLSIYLSIYMIWVAGSVGHQRVHTHTHTHTRIKFMLGEHTHTHTHTHTHRRARSRCCSATSLAMDKSLTALCSPVFIHPYTRLHSLFWSNLLIRMRITVLITMRITMLIDETTLHSRFSVESVRLRKPPLRWLAFCLTRLGHFLFPPLLTYLLNRGYVTLGFLLFIGTCLVTHLSCAIGHIPGPWLARPGPLCLRYAKFLGSKVRGFC